MLSHFTPHRQHFSAPVCTVVRTVFCGEFARGANERLVGRSSHTGSGDDNSPTCARHIHASSRIYLPKHRAPPLPLTQWADDAELWWRAHCRSDGLAPVFPARAPSGHAPTPSPPPGCSAPCPALRSVALPCGIALLCGPHATLPHQLATRHQPPPASGQQQATAAAASATF